MGRHVDTSREACEAAALPTLAELAATAKLRLPDLNGATVNACLAAGPGAGIVHDEVGVYVLEEVDLDAASPVVLALHEELAEQVDAGLRPVDVARLIVMREKRAVLALRDHVARARQAVAA